MKLVILSLLLPIASRSILFNDTTHFSIWMPQNGAFVADFNLFEDTLLQSYSFCSNLTAAANSRQDENEQRMVRCMLPLFQSVRLRKVVNLHNVALTFDKLGYHQGQIWSLITLLNHFEHVDRDGGELIISQLLLFNPLLKTEHMKQSFLALHPDLELVLIANGKTLHELSLSSINRHNQQCDAVLLLPSYSEPDNTIVKNYVSMLVKDAFSPILWLSHDSSAHSNRQTLLSWRLTSTWTKISVFLESEDRNGFLAKSYDFDFNRDYSVSTVYLGCLAPPPIVSWSAQTVIIITYTIRVFADTALGLQMKLIQQLGYQHVFVLLELSFESLLFLEANFPSYRLLHIAIAPHDITSLLHERYIVYHMEQDWSVITSGPSQLHYNHILRHALAVWTFSTRQQKSLLGRGVNELLSVYLVPVDTISRQKMLESQNKVEFAYDLIFFGSCLTRRQEMVKDLYHRVHAEFKLGIYCGGWKECIFDEERDTAISHAKLALNLHAHEQSVLEVHRVTYLLSMGKCVLSERGSDALLAKQFEQAVIFVDSIEEVQAKMTWLLSNEQARKDCEEKAMHEFIRMSSVSKELKYAMDKAEEQLVLLA